MSDNNIDATAIEDITVEYVYGPDPYNSDRMGILIKEGEFSDVFISFNKIKPTFNEETEELMLSFDYDVIGVPEGINADELSDSQSLHEVVSKIAFDEYMKMLELEAKKLSED